MYSSPLSISCLNSLGRLKSKAPPNFLRATRIFRRAFELENSSALKEMGPRKRVQSLAKKKVRGNSRWTGHKDMETWQKRDTRTKASIWREVKVLKENPCTVIRVQEKSKTERHKRDKETEWQRDGDIEIEIGMQTTAGLVYSNHSRHVARPHSSFPFQPA